ncbi:MULTISPECIES: IclR family transcriptional regulator [unclassified Microbacterium]|uniref:IclR family transcriptional regulator n=1 Tax=unclassified Microbacterium TaxID=2609290 RepID=UPI00049328ED|nr:MULTISPECIES: IclR family transcriptional regulator [unclassified Microbacterium]MCV0335513.1 IclR family transcriptional regulator [Microbacterium sp.]MCV0376991.1 IclR family transcriptional regulator [Microbacterium sp.]MCV0390531.1 IclR family transcriptional regulator [Microbacterium sp.]MCV0418266.1 IclR family transcriptional regulator [Microbacterium sp.]MCV0422066.1 IclR family transcriptional regulator [Microbacterium sp.]
MPDSTIPSPASQTLSRGIRILEVLADARGPLTIDEIASRLGVHRSIAYRLLRTLEDHGLVTRDASGAVSLGARMAALAAGVAHDLQAEALPELTAIANELGMTCFLAVLDGTECITLASVEPRHAVASVAQRPGARHPVSVGAPGKAILAQVPVAEWPEEVPASLPADVDAARARGYATSHDEVIPTVQSVAVPLTLRGQRPAAIAVVHVATDLDDAEIAARLRQAASDIRDALDG